MKKIKADKIYQQKNNSRHNFKAVDKCNPKLFPQKCYKPLTQSNGMSWIFFQPVCLTSSIFGLLSKKLILLRLVKSKWVTGNLLAST